MTILLAPHHRFTRHPIELNRPARTGERLVTMPRIIAPSERQQCAFGWRHFENHIVQIVPGAQQAKAPAGRFPARIHIDKDRDDLRLRIGVDFAVLFTAAAAHRNHVRAIRQVDIEFFLERFAEFIAAHFSEKLPARLTSG